MDKKYYKVGDSVFLSEYIPSSIGNLIPAYVDVEINHIYDNKVEVVTDNGITGITTFDNLNPNKEVNIETILNVLECYIDDKDLIEDIMMDLI